MKSRITDCKKCREQLWLDLQYDVFSNCIDSAACSAAVMSLAVLDRMGFTDEQMKKFFDEYVLISSISEVFGKAITAEDAMKKYEERLGIDFDKIECHYETKSHFMSRYRRENKK